MKKGNFFANDPLVVRGNFQIDAGDANGNWQGNMFSLTDTDNDSVFTVAAQFPDTKIGTIYNYKFVMHEVWEPTPNHIFTLDNSLTQNLPVYYFANDSIVLNAIINTIKFTADLTGIYGIGPTFFDPNNDSLLVWGFSPLTGNIRLFEVPNPPRRFKTTLSVKGYLGDSVKWKYRALPSSHFNNNGWELGEDRWFTYKADSSVIILPETKPEFIVVSAPLTTDVTVMFVCNMNNNAVNRYTGLCIPVNQIQFVGVKGGATPLGNWGGNWSLSDTAGPNPSILKLNDSGQNGDTIAGDNIWSGKAVFPAGSQPGKIGYKYGCMYPGADTVNNGFAPLDNESEFGLNHSVTLYQTNSIIKAYQMWGYMWDAIDGNAVNEAPDFSLNQNYPNPFNPATTISYTIPEDGFVTLTIYNTLGQETAVLFDGFHKRGQWNVPFNGISLSSGVYFYTLRTGKFLATRKMLLMK